MTTTCPYCNAPGHFAFKAGDHFYGVTNYQASLYQCAANGCLFQDPIPPREDIAAFYPSGYWQEDANPSIMTRLQDVYITGMLNADLMRLVTRLGPPGGSWLDVGCSRGDWAALIKARGWQVSGLEADPRAAQYAREVHDIEVAEGDGDSWNPTARKYDVISFFHLLEHLRDPVSFLKRCHEALRPGGRILLRIPNIRSWQFSVFGKRWKGLEMPRHITLPTPNAVKQCIADAGFQIDVATTWAFRDGPPSIASSLFPTGEPTRQHILGRSQPVATLCYLALTWALTPLEVLASLCGRGAMLTIIARKQ